MFFTKLYLVFKHKTTISTVNLGCFIKDQTFVGKKNIETNSLEKCYAHCFNGKYGYIGLNE